MAKQIFTLTLLKAGAGDAVWICAGEHDNVKHILIDTGLSSTAPVLAAHVKAMESRYGKPVVISLLVLTHIDADHINGAELFLKHAKTMGVQIQALWFNGYRQVFAKKREAHDVLGARKAECISAWAETLGIAINPGLDEDVALTTATWARHHVGLLDLPAGFDITLLGPTPERIASLQGKWRTDMKGKPGTSFAAALNDVLGQGEYGSDSSAANGASVALLLEYADISLLMTGDAFASDLAAALKSRPDKKVTFFKLSHHGSPHNISNALIESCPAPHYLISGLNSYTDTIKLVHRENPQSVFHFNYAAPRDRILAAEPTVHVGGVPGHLGLDLDLIATSFPGNHATAT